MDRANASHNTNMADSTIRTKYKGEENMPQNPLESIPENILI